MGCQIAVPPRPPGSAARTTSGHSAGRLPARPGRGPAPRLGRRPRLVRRAADRPGRCPSGAGRPSAPPAAPTGATAARGPDGPHGASPGSNMAALAWYVNRSGSPVVPCTRIATEVKVSGSLSSEACVVASDLASTGAPERATHQLPARGGHHLAQGLAGATGQRRIPVLCQAQDRHLGDVPVEGVLEPLGDKVHGRLVVDRPDRVVQLERVAQVEAREAPDRLAWPQQRNDPGPELLDGDRRAEPGHRLDGDLRGRESLRQRGLIDRSGAVGGHVDGHVRPAVLPDIGLQVFDEQRRPGHVGHLVELGR